MNSETNSTSHASNGHTDAVARTSTQTMTEYISNIMKGQGITSREAAEAVILRAMRILPEYRAYLPVGVTYAGERAVSAPVLLQDMIDNGSVDIEALRNFLNKIDPHPVVAAATAQHTTIKLVRIPRDPSAVAAKPARAPKAVREPKAPKAPRVPRAPKLAGADGAESRTPRVAKNAAFDALNGTQPSSVAIGSLVSDANSWRKVNIIAAEATVAAGQRLPDGWCKPDASVLTRAMSNGQNYYVNMSTSQVIVHLRKMSLMLGKPIKVNVNGKDTVFTG